jgi:hypothetical protein
MTDEQVYISYLETKVCDQAFRIGELEASLIVALIKVNKSKTDINLGVTCDNCPEELYIKLLDILQKGIPYSRETTEKLKELYAA